MKEHHIAVRRTARYYTLGEPTAPELWFVIHGYGQLARRFLRRFQPLDDGSRLLVAPEALSRYYFETSPGMHAPDAEIGATWMTREDRLTEIADYIAYLDDLCDAVIASCPRTPSRIVALGFSQGVATVARWIAAGRTRVHELVLWAGYLPAELEPRATLFHGARLTWMLGRADAYTPESRIAPLSARLSDAGLAHEVVWYPGAHRIESDALQSLALRLPPLTG